MYVELMEAFEIIRPFLPVIGLLILVQFALMVAALIHAVKHQRFKTGNLILWVLVIIFVNTLGPILYFIIGKADDMEETEDDD